MKESKMSDERRDDGGPAFAKTGSFNLKGDADFNSLDQDGMSLRAYIASEQMAGYSAAETIDSYWPSITKAKRAVEDADALLEELKK